MIEPPRSATENFDHEAVLEQYFKSIGRHKVHRCPDAHYMAIHDKSAEFTRCQCDKAALP